METQLAPSTSYKYYTNLQQYKACKAKEKAKEGAMCCGFLSRAYTATLDLGIDDKHQHTTTPAVQVNKAVAYFYRINNNKCYCFEF